MMIKSYQQRRALQTKPKPADVRLAEVKGVHGDGLTIHFEGDPAPKKRRFKRNTSITFAVGQRVVVRWVSGSYIVEYPFG